MQISEIYGLDPKHWSLKIPFLGIKFPKNSPSQKEKWHFLK